ncbi:hypothetical protein RJ45_18675 [Photobacterium gaetbulicola]|uniref:Uncharacterized protein n=1 Tax=Photobacterium gaetbulicola TaxID=1295392 RepID=A0A0B9GBC9_9GAMM|nr:hypothetical protein [Photobacterium gaetbulicola]KHT62185.1 hypothetical protein RJ45_18675 [Photobacterium gaetbulicola]
MIGNINILFLLGFLSYSSQPGNQLEKATDEICLCLEAPYQQAEKTLKQLLGAQLSGDLAKVTQSQDEMMAVINASRLCLESFHHLYPDIAQDMTLKGETLKRLDSKCPDPLSAHRSQLEEEAPTP